MKKVLCLITICFTVLLAGCSTMANTQNYSAKDEDDKEAIPVLAYASTSNAQAFIGSSIVASVKYSIQFDSSQNIAQIYFDFNYYTDNLPTTIIAKAEEQDGITCNGIIGVDDKNAAIWPFYKPIEGPCCAELKANDFSDKTVKFTFFDYDTITPLYNKDKQVLTCNVNFKDL